MYGAMRQRGCEEEGEGVKEDTLHMLSIDSNPGEDKYISCLCNRYN